MIKSLFEKRPCQDRVNDDLPPVKSLEIAAAELLRATGQLLRRLRTETNLSELTWSQVAALARLDENGWMTTADLACAEGAEPQSMSITLAGLEQASLVQRRLHPSDGWRGLVFLTERGIAVKRRNTQLKREWLSAIMAKLDPAEKQTFIAAVALIRRLSDS
jgi:DNA-binding MarR family transcriptional regulator